MVPWCHGTNEPSMPSPRTQHEHCTLVLAMASIWWDPICRGHRRKRKEEERSRRRRGWSAEVAKTWEAFHTKPVNKLGLGHYPKREEHNVVN